MGDQKGPNPVLLTGWGLTAASVANLVTVDCFEAAIAALDDPPERVVVARGLGRSYGDAAQNAGGKVLDATGLSGVRSIDEAGLMATVGAGTSIGSLIGEVLPRGLWPAVTPGTRHVTIGGAVAADVHGKNHHRDGSFGAHVTSLVLHTPAKGTLTLSPHHQADLFWATVGGMGLTGLISEVTVRLLPVETSTMRVDRERKADLDALMRRMVEADGSYRYSVAWVDGLARGRHLGRSVVEFAEHATLEDLPVRRRTPARSLAWPHDRGDIGVPAWMPGMLSRPAVTAFNELWYRKVPKGPHRHLVPAKAFFYPLDRLRNWNRLYGRAGFIQYQLVVPDSQEDVIRRSLAAISATGAASFLAVLKRFGRSSPGILSFPRPGWTLAVDLPARVDGLGRVLDDLDEVVAAAGGRVYLAKDSRLRPDLVESMYPDLPRWRSIRDQVDPQRVLRSDMDRRLHLTVARTGT
jgi:decaprenylphospho-beta-D-ribofuranose 2-oxidase